jgi:hypothetical protein
MGATKYSTTNVVKAKTADELAAQYGVVNKQADIAATLKSATDAKFGMWDTQMKGIRDQQLTDYSGQMNQYQKYARENRQNALRSGLGRGSSVAQEVMSQVQSQQFGAQNQTQYQQQLADIAAQKGAQQGADVYNAMDMANQTNLALAGLSTTQQTTETAGQTGYLNYLAGLANANATKYSADQNVVASSKYGGAANEEAYARALKILGGDENLAFQVTYNGLDIKDAVKQNQFDGAGFPKNAAEGATFPKGNYMYKTTGGVWVLMPPEPVSGQGTGESLPWNWADITTRK